jgi:hypothetical protein
VEDDDEHTEFAELDIFSDLGSDLIGLTPRQDKSRVKDPTASRAQYIVFCRLEA